MFRAPSLPRTFDAALRDLGAVRADVRADAARDLVSRVDEGRARALTALEAALRDEDAKVRKAAATGLADANAVESVAALLAAAADPETEVRGAVISALGELGETSAGGRVREALTDARPEVRFQAVIAFPRVARTKQEAVEVLLKATHDADDLVVQIALRMAEEVAGEDRDTLDERVFTRARALLVHGRPTVRVASAVFLARASVDRADRAVREVLVAVALGELASSDGEDKAAAIELCGDLALRAALPGLEKRAFGGLVLRRDRFAWHARVALARMGHERACADILRELGSWDRDRRTLAVAAAGQARLASARPLIASMHGDPRRADPHAVDEALAAIAGATPS